MLYEIKSICPAQPGWRAVFFGEEGNPPTVSEVILWAVCDGTEQNENGEEEVTPGVVHGVVRLDADEDGDGFDVAPNYCNFDRYLAPGVVLS
jgi:hypothetical protein